MKRLIFTFALVVMALFGFGQNPTNELEKNIIFLDTAKSAVSQAEITTRFDQLANADSQNWLVAYYAAYSQLLLGIRGQQDQETKDEIYDKALHYLTKADSLSPNNSEVYVMKAYAVFMKMSVYPQKRAMTMIVESNQLIEKAIALDPENPRAYFIKGQTSFYVPEMFGGGKPAAQVSLTAAKEKFEKFRAKPLFPNWGKLRTDELLKEIN